MIAPITDHSELARQRLADQFKDTDSWIGLLQSLAGSPAESPDEATGLQKIEDTGSDLIQKRGLNPLSGVTGNIALGAQLDGIGDLVDQARAAGEEDEEYRNGIRSRIILNNSNGSTEEVVSLWKWLTSALGEGGKARLLERYPGAVRLWSNRAPALETLPEDEPFYPENLRGLIQSALPAGVKLLELAASPRVDIPAGFSELLGESLTVHEESGDDSLTVNSEPLFVVSDDHPINPFCENHCVGFGDGSGAGHFNESPSLNPPHGSFAESLTRRPTHQGE